jgi:hypothetical protein
VLSNIPFLIVGALGLAFVSRPSPSFLESWERWPAAVLMFALFLTAFGSAYYHTHIGARLMWAASPQVDTPNTENSRTLGQRASGQQGRRNAR